MRLGKKEDRGKRNRMLHRAILILTLTHKIAPGGKRMRDKLSVGASRDENLVVAHRCPRSRNTAAAGGLANATLTNEKGSTALILKKGGMHRERSASHKAMVQHARCVRHRGEIRRGVVALPHLGDQIAAGRVIPKTYEIQSLAAPSLGGQAFKKSLAKPSG
jgi:hypothetical protein